MRIANCKTLVPMFLIGLLSIVPTHALSILEGRISGEPKASGSYDLLIQVWCKSGDSDTSKLMQTIQIPEVKVVDGKFQVLLENAGAYRASEPSYKIQARPFEAWEPFRPAEISRVSIETMSPGLVLR